MPACQISFSDFARAFANHCVLCGESLSSGHKCGSPEPAPCTPPVQQTAPAVVAHPVAADGGECISAAGFMRRLHRSRLVRAGRALPPCWGVEIGGCVVLYRSRAKAWNNASRYSYARFVEVCQ